MRLHRHQAEEGSIAVAMMVMMVVSFLIVGFLAVVQSGLKQSRRSGDAANALQVADAGVNDAVKQLAIKTTNFSGASSLGGSGSYTYAASKDGTTWHIDVTGTDPSGVKRHVLADAVDQGLFTNAFFSLNAPTIKGSADSYTGPNDTCSTPGVGTIGSNNPIHFTGGNGNATNCHGQYGADGCIYYGQSANPPNPFPDGRCPPAPASSTTDDPFVPPSISAPPGVPSSGAFDCNGGVIPSGTHVYSNITLDDGCHVANGTTAVLYATGNVTIGTSQGNCKNVVNQPPTASGCSDNNNYQAGWPANLQIFVIGNGTISVANHALFWGVIDAPDGTLSDGNGAPQVDVWGAIIVHDAGTAAQFHFHYDSSLAGLLRTGRYQTTNWREEPLS